MKKLIIFLALFISAVSQAQTYKFVTSDGKELTGKLYSVADSAAAVYVIGNGMEIVPMAGDDTVKIRNGIIDSLIIAYGRQPLLVSGTNIKTINSTTLLGSGNFSLEPAIGNPGTNGYYLTRNTDGTNIWVAGSGGGEPALGNPSTNGYILSSTTAGVRSWIAPGGGGGDAYLGNTQTFTQPQTIQGTAAGNGGQLGTELIGAATGTDWTGSSLVTGYTKTPGTTNALTSSYTPTINTYYRIVVTITGTTGTGSWTFGGYSSATMNFGTSLDVSPQATSTAAFVFTPSSGFDGVVTVTVKNITNADVPAFTIKNNSGTIITEIRGVSVAGSQFVGRNSGLKITTGTGNTGTGDAALQNVTSGTYNTATGINALIANTLGSNNQANGSLALFTNTVGNQNSVSGDQAAYSNTTGSANSIVGYKAFYNATTGSNNIAVGQNAARYLADGSTALVLTNNSVFLGVDSRAGADNQTNQIVIGYQAVSGASNSAVIGNSSITSIKLNGALTLPHSTYSTAAVLLKTTITTGAVVAAVANTDYLSTTANAVKIGIGKVPTSLFEVTNQSTIQTALSGTTAHFIGTDATPLRVLFDTHNAASVFGTSLFGRRSRGTSTTPAALTADDVMMSITGLGYGTSQYAANSTGLIAIKANETFTNTANGTYIAFFTTPNASVTAAEVGRFNATDLTLGLAGTMVGNLKLSGNTSGTTSIVAPAVAGGTLTLPIVTGTLVQYKTATITSNAAPAPTGDAFVNELTVTAQAVTGTFAAPSGTAVQGNRLIIRIEDNATPQTLAWNAIYRGGTDIALPLITTSAKVMYIAFIYNSTDTKWDCVGKVDGL